MKSTHILLPALALLIVLCVTAGWWYSRSLDVTGKTTTIVKNDRGQPCSLWWWKPSEEPAAVLHSESQGGEWYSVWNSNWMVEQWFLVAEVGEPVRETEAFEGTIKVYLVSPPPPQTNSNDRMFLARPKELTKKRSWWP